MSSTARARLRYGIAGLATSLVAGMGAATFASPQAAAAPTDPCTVPQLSDVMISQGLPSYTALVAGKPALMKLFLSTPGCLPVGATVSVTGATLSVNGAADAPLQVQAPVPLPPIGPPATAPVPSTASDLIFLVPGNLMQPQGSTSQVTFTVKVQYKVVTSATAEPVPGEVTFGQPGTANPLAAVVLPNPNPLNVLVVPAGSSSRTAAEQYTETTRRGVAAGISALARMLPVAESGGLNAFENAGMIALGSAFPSCVTASNFLAGTRALEDLRVVWNAANRTTHTSRVLAQVDQAVSTGPSTQTTATNCADGYAQVGTADADGVISIGRVVRSTVAGKQITGSTAAMELGHTAGTVDPKYAFNGTGTSSRATVSFHSTNSVADVTAPGRGYNLSSRAFISQPYSFMRFSPTVWDDATSLAEAQDYDYLMCALFPPAGTPRSIKDQLGTNAPAQLTTCANPGGMGVASYRSDLNKHGTYAISGATDGTPGGTSAYSTDSESNYVDPEQANSSYRLVQTDAQGDELSDVGVAVRQVAQHHHHHGVGGDSGTVIPHGGVGTFGMAVAKAPGATKLELRKKIVDPTTGVVTYTPLYTKTVQPAPPTFQQIDVAGNTVTIHAGSTDAPGLKLDVLLDCTAGGGTTSVLVANLSPVVSTSGAAVFVTRYDASLGCPNGQVRYHLTDGTQSAYEEGEQTSGSWTDVGAITAPTAGEKLLASQSVSLAGSATDRFGRAAARYAWSIRHETGATFNAPEGSPIVTPTAGHFPHGGYQAVMRAYAAGAAEPFITVEQPFTLLRDQDGDGIPDERESQPCYAAWADPVRDPGNANADSDGDGVANVSDENPCDFPNTIQVGFHPHSLFKSSSGNHVTAYLSGSPRLAGLTHNDVFITQIANYPVHKRAGAAGGLQAVSYTVTGPAAATVKFDRAAVVRALGDLTGYIPIFVGTRDRTLRGADPTYPRVFP